jgi:hypothetical protein
LSKSVKISGLPAASAANLTDEIPATQDDTTRRVTVQQISDVIAADLIPNASLLGGDGDSLTAVSIGTGLGLSGGTLTATGASLTIPDADLIGGDGSALSGVSVGDGLTLASGTLTADATALTVPDADLLAGDGTDLSGVTVGTGLSLSGGTLTATGTSLTVPTADIVGGDGSALTSVTVGDGLAFGSGTLSLDVPDSQLLGGDGSKLESVVAGNGLSFALNTLSVNFGTTSTEAAAGDDSRITGALQADNNLSDLDSAKTARVNIDQGLSILTSALSISTPCTNSNVFTLDLQIDATLANPTGAEAGGRYQWIITSNNHTLAYGTAFKFPGGTAPTLSAGVDVLSAVYDGTNFLAVLTKDFS